MTDDDSLTKGQRTAQRILDEAEQLFAERGYEGTTLREIAAAAGIAEPGLYNHFKGKLKLYQAVLNRALQPMSNALEQQLASDTYPFDDLPALMTDLLLEHPRMAALFQQALHGDPDSPGNQLVAGWLHRLFQQGASNLRRAESEREQDPADIALRVIAMFNITTGYFLSQRAFSHMAEGDLLDVDNVARQKQLLRRVVGTMMG